MSEGQAFGIFGGRSDSVAGSSGYLIHEVRVGQALRDSWLTKCSGYLVEELRLSQALRKLLWTK